MPRLRLPRPLWIALATAVLVVVAVGVRVGVPAYRQREAIRELELRGGVIQFRPKSPDWVRRYLSDEWQEAVDEVCIVSFPPKLQMSRGPPSFFGEPVDDATLQLVARFAQLRMFEVNSRDIGDSGVRYLSGLTRLKWLDLSYTNVSDASVPILVGLRELEELELSCTLVSDEGIETLRAALPDCTIRDFGRRKEK